MGNLRIERRQRHLLIEIIMKVICMVPSLDRCRSVHAKKESWVIEFLKFLNGEPTLKKAFDLNSLKFLRIIAIYSLF